MGIPVAVSRLERVDSSPGRGPPGSGSGSLGSARPGASNGIRPEVVACL